MRRFITSLPGKVFSQLVILALLLPSITFILANRASGQIAVNPSLAVVEFTNQKEPNSHTYGKIASDAVLRELGKTGQYDVRPAPTVDRAIASLGITSPPDTQNLFRVAQEVRAQLLVTGNIVDYRIVHGAGGSKQAEVAANVVVYDVASEVPVNGAIISGKSIVAPASADDVKLLTDALNQGANTAIRSIQSVSLPQATVLNTQVHTALINQGSRSGFQEGQHVIILRGRAQVATGSISEVEPDSATLTVERFTQGVQPGDKVRVIFTPPQIVGFGADNEPKLARRHKSVAGNSAVISALLVVGLVVALLSNGNANNTGAAAEVTAEAELVGGQASQEGVRISWTPDGFAKGNAYRSIWQVWRGDITDGPVAAVSGDQTSADNLVSDTTPVAWGTAPLTGTACVTYTSESHVAEPVTIGRPYSYRVQLLFAVSPLDLPQGTTSGTTGTTGTTTSSTGTTGTTTSSTGTTGTTTSSTGTTTSSTGTTTSSTGTTTSSTGTTGTTTSTTGTTGSNNATCYFLSGFTNAIGLATPVAPPNLINPPASLNGIHDFVFSTSVNPTFPITVEYVLQFSSDPGFAKSSTYTWPTPTYSASTGTPKISADPTAAGVPGSITTSTTVYVRIGARNIQDNPGPIPDMSTGQRFIFGTPASFTHSPTPPPPAVKKRKRG